MQKSKLLRSLRILNREETKGLHSFLQSPYFNSNSNIVKLYRVLQPYYPNFQSPKLDREKVFQKVFPGKKYAHQQMLNLMSEFNGLLERFLVVRQMEKKKLLDQKLLLEAYISRSASYNTFLKKYQNLNDAIEKLPYRDEIYFQEKMNLNLMYYDHPRTQLQKDDRGTLFQAIRCFDLYKSLADVKLKCAQNARQNSIKDKETQILKTEEENVLLILYNRLENFQRVKKEENFHALFNELKLSIQLLRDKDRRNMLKILINYCSRKSNSGDTTIFYTTFELYKLGLEYNCVLVNDNIKTTTFHNIVSVGSICQEFDWVKDFIEKYQTYLDDKAKDVAVRMAMGVWYFEKKAFDEAIEKLNFSFREPKDIIKSKSLLIRSWFELWLTGQDYFEFLYTQLDTFEKFIRRNQLLTEKVKTSFLKFIVFTRKLLTIVRDQKKLEEISQEIEKQHNLVFKKWLLDKSKHLK